MPALRMNKVKIFFYNIVLSLPPLLATLNLYDKILENIMLSCGHSDFEPKYYAHFRKLKGGRRPSSKN